ncbi:hypothetical protein PVAP13_1KG415805 [Panicum virgatum]|uniref:Uncharacterized protein n=1 Tax=Panicum virgatum TaxID=38727 RepID=A0A8T0XT01_PANVG|nr:hypothetical protein PVAP13_1KG415805 [Panicum virgatum]
MRVVFPRIAARVIHTIRRPAKCKPSRASRLPCGGAIRSRSGSGRRHPVPGPTPTKSRAESRSWKHGSHRRPFSSARLVPGHALHARQGADRRDGDRHSLRGNFRFATPDGRWRSSADCPCSPRSTPMSFLELATSMMPVIMAVHAIVSGLFDYDLRTRHIGYDTV